MAFLSEYPKEKDQNCVKYITRHRFQKMPGYFCTKKEVKNCDAFTKTLPKHKKALKTLPMGATMQT
jgi:hypothetical protein